MNKKQLYVLLAAILLVCVIAVVCKCSASEKQTVVSPTDDSSQFVTLTDAVPDVILEIRYFGTYNFVGTRIDGYLEPTGRSITAEQFANRMLLRRAMLSHGFKPLESEWWHFTLKDEPFPDTYFTFPVKQL